MSHTHAESFPYGEVPGVPPSVDFAAIAERSIAEGIFAVDPSIEEKNQLNDAELPTYPLELPYVNGPMTIKLFEKDVPVAQMQAVRKNIVAANKVLIPTEQIGLYFHQRFTQDNVLYSTHLANKVAAYEPIDKGAAQLLANKDATSFQIEDPARKQYNRHFFTEAELNAGQNFAVEHPEAVLSVLAYNAVIQDYFAELRTAYVERVYTRGDVTMEDVEHFDKYVVQWSTDNIANTLIPALTVLHADAQAKNPQTNADALFTRELFSKAFEFIIDNGAFRNWVRVPAHIAEDGTARVNKFLCPAVSSLREQLGDGSLLESVYAVIANRAAAGDFVVSDMLSKIQENAQKVRDEISPEERTQLMLERERQKKLYPTVLDGAEITPRMDYSEYRLLEGEHTPGDQIVEYSFADDLPTVLRRAVNVASEGGAATFFIFNDQGYRITPDTLRLLAQQQAEVEE